MQSEQPSCDLDEYGAPMQYVSIRMRLPSDEVHWKQIKRVLGDTENFIAFAHCDTHWHIFIIGEGDVTAKYRGRIMRLDNKSIKKDMYTIRHYHRGMLLQNLHKAGRERTIVAPRIGASKCMKELDALAVTFEDRAAVAVDMRGELDQVRAGVRRLIDEKDEDLKELKAEFQLMKKCMRVLRDDNQSLGEAMVSLTKRIETLEDAADPVGSASNSNIAQILATL